MDAIANNLIIGAIININPVEAVAPIDIGPIRANVI